MASKRGFDSNEPTIESWQLPSSPFNPDNKDLLGARDPRDPYWLPDGIGMVVYKSVVNEAGQALEQWHPIRLACEHWAPGYQDEADCRFGCGSRGDEVAA
jgi:hypothetical protein